MSSIRATSQKSEKDQWAILAFLRFFLASAVFLGHYSLFIRGDSYHLLGAGYLNPGSAVYGFFILSGYSIAASLNRETTGFYRRRFVRIWPLYLVCVVCGVAIGSFFAPYGFVFPRGFLLHPATTLSIVASAVMLQSFASAAVPMVGQIWSLSIEWWHYMVTPKLKNVSSLVLLFWIVASFGTYLFLSPFGNVERLRYGLAAVVTSWMWMTGFLYHRLRRTPFGFAVLGAPSVFAATLGCFTGAPLFASIFVLLLATEVTLPKQLSKAFNFLGDLSYPIYLFHTPVMVGMLLLGRRSPYAMSAAVLAVSALLLYLVDYPSRKLFSRSNQPAFEIVHETELPCVSTLQIPAHESVDA